MHSVQHFLRSSCPACGGENIEPFYQLLIDSACFQPFRCLTCRLVYISNPLADEGLANQEKFPEKPLVRVRHQQIVRMIDRYVKMNELSLVDVVEIGCGHGALGTLLQKNTKCCYRGFEPDLARASYCLKNGLNVVNDYFDATYLRLPADIIVLDNVLEHVSNLEGLFCCLSESLKSGGIMIIIVPNLYDVRRLLPKWRNRHYWQPHCHINYFSYRSLDNLLKRFGFDMHPFSFSSIEWFSEMLFFPKVIFDQIGFRFGGLYCFGVKRRDAAAVEGIATRP